MTNEEEPLDYQGKERRQYVRIPFQRNIKYRLCYEKFASTILDADASNISQNGILFKTKYPPPSTAVIALNIPPDKLREYLVQEKLTDLIDVDDLYIRGQSLFGEVIRVIEDTQSGFFSVAVKLILKIDPEAAKKVEEAKKKKNHPQYIDPSLVEEEEKYGKKEAPPAHPQYIDPSLEEEEDTN